VTAKPIFTTSAIYLTAVGLALMTVPLQFGRGAVPANAAPELIALLRLLGGPFLGIAVLNWLSRDTDPATIRPIVLANLVGFGAVVANDAGGGRQRRCAGDRQDLPVDPRAICGRIRDSCFRSAREELSLGSAAIWRGTYQSRWRHSSTASSRA